MLIDFVVVAVAIFIMFVTPSFTEDVAITVALDVFSAAAVVLFLAGRFWLICQPWTGSTPNPARLPVAWKQWVEESGCAAAGDGVAICRLRWRWRQGRICRVETVMTGVVFQVDTRKGFAIVVMDRGGVSKHLLDELLVLKRLPPFRKAG